VFGLILVLLSVAMAAEARDAAPLEAGCARVDITPPLGDVHYRGRSVAVADPLWAKVLYLRQGEVEAAIVLCDVISVRYDTAQAIRRQAARLTEIPPEHIAVAATHTHTGLFSPGQLDETIAAIAATVGTAREAAQPVDIAAGTAQQDGLAFNRRFRMRDGSVRFNPGFQNPDIVEPVGPADPEVGIVLFREAASRQPLASLTSFALHLDTVASAVYSADYPYFLEQTLRRELGESFVSFFGTGACGNVNHYDVSGPPPTPGHEGITRQIGQTLGETVLGALASLTPARPRLAVRQTVVDAPLQTFTDEELAWAESYHQTRQPLVEERVFLQQRRAAKIRSLAELRKRWGPTLPLEVQVYRIADEVAVVTLPGEVFVELGLAIKEGSPFATTLIVELANDAPAYIPDREAFPQGDYEVINSRVAAGGGEMLVEAALRLLNELDPSK
jgi:neutral ceramidase